MKQENKDLIFNSIDDDEESIDHIKETEEQLLTFENVNLVEKDQFKE